MLPTAPLQAGGPGLALSVALVLLGLGVLAVFARRALQRFLAMLATEPVGAGEVSPGMVELEGAVVPDGGTVDVHADTQPAEAVLARRRRRSRSERVAGFTLPVLERLAPNALYDTSARPFYLEDDTGRVLVDAARADVSLGADHSRQDDRSDHAGVEAWLGPGDDVYVLGEVVPAAAYPDRASLPGGFLRWLRGDERDTGQTAEAPLREDELVVTRTPRTSEFVVSDTAGGYSLLRRGLVAAFWTVSGLVALGVGLYLFIIRLGV
ncbi:MAG: hypothetical protein V5A13_02705 [Haloarculaceae archaeon]